MFDGDGWFTIGKYNATGMGFCSGSLDFLTSINNITSNIINKKCKKIHNGSGAFNLSFFGDDILKISEWMYCDNTICLDRKYTKYLKIKDILSNRKSIKYSSEETDILTECVNKKMKRKEIYPLLPQRSIKSIGYKIEQIKKESRS